MAAKDESRAYNAAFEAEGVDPISSREEEEALRDINHEISTCTDSAACVSLAKHWLPKCQASRPACKTLSHPQLPLRLIDVENLEEKLVCLHISDPAIEYGMYLTLRYVPEEEYLLIVCTTYSGTTTKKVH